jgi:hypothetical protein
MRDQLNERLQNLKNEFESGQKMLNDANLKQKELHSTLLRIQGAIQVLEEELNKQDADISTITDVTT